MDRLTKQNAELKSTLAKSVTNANADSSTQQLIANLKTENENLLRKSAGTQRDRSDLERLEFLEKENYDLK
eukprot:Pgem_evm1s11587